MLNIETGGIRRGRKAKRIFRRGLGCEEAKITRGQVKSNCSSPYLTIFRCNLRGFADQSEVESLKSEDGGPDDEWPQVLRLSCSRG